MAVDKRSAGELVAVLDMGASAIRLVIAEVVTGRPIQFVEQASRGVLLGRDTFSGGVIRPKTADATFDALDGFRHIIDVVLDLKGSQIGHLALYELQIAVAFLKSKRHFY